MSDVPGENGVCLRLGGLGSVLPRLRQQNRGRRQFRSNFCQRRDDSVYDAIGIESLSREAAFIRFTDLNRLPVETIKDNLVVCGFNKQAEVRRGDAFAMLKATPDTQFDYLYIAPPQYKEMWFEALKLVDENPGWLSETGEVIVQIHPREYQEIELANLQKFEERKYGSTLLVFYEKKG